MQTGQEGGPSMGMSQSPSGRTRPQSASFVSGIPAWVSVLDSDRRLPMYAPARTPKVAYCIFMTCTRCEVRATPAPLGKASRNSRRTQSFALA
jgi:hypothetical protein